MSAITLTGGRQSGRTTRMIRNARLMMQEGIPLIIAMNTLQDVEHVRELLADTMGKVSLTVFDEIKHRLNTATMRLTDGDPEVRVLLDHQVYELHYGGLLAMIESHLPTE